MPRYRIKFWFPDSTKQVLFASDDLPEIAGFQLRLRALLQLFPDDEERFQQELVDEQNRVGFVHDETPVRVEWQDPPIKAGEDFFAVKPRREDQVPVETGVED